jgi:hypothetical protein
MVVYVQNDRQHLYDLTTGLPRAQPGSVLWDALYNAETDMRLSPDERIEAGQEAAAAEAAAWLAAVEETVTTGVPPVDYVVITLPNDPLASLSKGRHLVPKWPGYWLLRKENAESAQSHGFSVTNLPR